MYARLSTLEGPPDGIEQEIASVREHVWAGAKQLDGFVGMTAFVDRATGKMMAVTFWDTEEALKASEEAAAELRSDSADAGSSRIAGVERLEVVFDERV
jgi:heme-degrading monooxygenase HmoA